MAHETVLKEEFQPRQPRYIPYLCFKMDTFFLKKYVAEFLTRFFVLDLIYFELKQVQFELKFNH